MRTTGTTLVATTAALLVMVAPALAQEGADVEVVDVGYAPTQVEVDAGGTVTWTQTGELPHTVTADDGSFDSHPDCGSGGPCMQSGDTFARTFAEPGEYPYYCRIHGGPGGVGMSGVVVVTAAGATEEPTEPPAAEPTDEPTDPGSDAAVTGSISVADQSGDGTTVSVSSVTIAGSDGWVVVHLDDDGAPGRVLGHTAVPEGTSDAVDVPLDEPLSGDATVWPMLHVDAGEPGTYEFPGADVPVTVDGAVVMAPLRFTVAAAGDAAGGSDDGLAETGAPLATLLAAAAAAAAGGFLLLRRRATG